MQKHAAHMMKGEYKPREFVLVTNERQHYQHDMKGQPRWFGPYIIMKHHKSGAFILQELDGAVLKKPVAWKRIKSYHYRKNLEPIVCSLSIPELEEGDNDPEVHTVAIKTEGPKLFKPWELKGHEANDYWHKKYQQMKKRREKGKVIAPNKPFPKHEDI